MTNKQQTKTFFAYTPEDFKVYVITDTRKPFDTKMKKKIYGDRATIAVSIDGNAIRYGIAICDENDKFDKVKGRYLANERLLAGFGRVDLIRFKKLPDNLDDLALNFLNNLTDSVYENYGKYKNKIKRFNGRSVTSSTSTKNTSSSNRTLPTIAYLK